MILGSFDNGSPFVEGLLVLPRLNIQEPVSFLVDTGADLTCLMPADSHRIGVDFARLQQRTTITGASGYIHPFVERAHVLFTEASGTERGYRSRRLIFPDEPELQELHSLLGQNIMGRWRIVHDFSRDILTCTVRSADRTRRA